MAALGRSRLSSNYEASFYCVETMKLGHKQAKKLRKALKNQMGVDYRKMPDLYKAAKRSIKKGEQTL